MADIYTSAEDERIIHNILRYGFEVAPIPSKWPKYISLRLALTKSLSIEEPPDTVFDYLSKKDKGGEYDLQQLTGKGNSKDDERGELDFNDVICGLMSVYHDEDLFKDENQYRQLLQRHIRRGLYEIKTSWNPRDEFTFWLKQELFGTTQQNYTEIEENDAQQLGESDVISALAELGIKAEINNVITGSRIKRYEILLAEAHLFSALRRSLDKINFSLGLKETEGVYVSLTDKPKIAALDIPLPPKLWKKIPVERIFRWSEQRHNGELPVWLGEDILGHDFGFDLVEAPHLMISGTTGSGKSVTLHAILFSLIKTLKPEELELVLIDPKMVELRQYHQIPYLHGKNIAYDVSETFELLSKTVAEMERRNKLLSQIGANNLSEANDKHKLGLPRIVVVVEELADLIIHQSKDIEALLIHLAQKARSAGIHLILATQRPDALTFSGLLRSNIPGRIALRVQKSSESKIILDETGAEKLLGAGDMLVKINANYVTRVHGAYISSEDIRRLAGSYG